MPESFDPLAIEYKFLTDDGEFSLSYGDYLKNTDLMARLADRRSYNRIVLGRMIVLMSRKRMIQDKTAREIYNDILNMRRKCGIAYFAPNGPGATAFLNDIESDVKCLLSGNQRGKTATGIIDDILDCVPCDPDWPIFKDHGVEFRPWRGEVTLTVLTYKWSHQMEVIWPRLKEWLPFNEISHYINNEKAVRWDKDQHIQLKCGSKINFRVYSQDQDVFEGPTWHRAHWDEQGVEEIFDGVDERIATQGWTPTHSFTLTPHAVAGRPDTGGGSWIEKLLKGENSKGKFVEQYNIHPDHVPDWIYPEKEKAKKYLKWIKEPAERGDMKTLREGRSRYYGEWHVGGGLVYDEWVREIHMIEPFEVPYEWTRYRGMDHGTRNPTTCAWVAVSPQGDLFLYDEYYETGKGIDKNVQNIIEQSGNERRVAEEYADSTNPGVVYYQEVEVNAHFEMTVLDPRSFASPDPNTNLNLGVLYRRAGLNIRAGTAQKNEFRIPKVKEWLQVDYTKKHPQTGKMGRPRFYVFSTCVNFVREIESRQWKKMPARNTTDAPAEVPEKKNDHLQNAMEYVINIPPRYYPPAKRRAAETNRNQGRKAVNARTGY